MLWGPPGTGAPDGRRRGLGRALRSGSVGVGHEISWLAWRGRAERAGCWGRGLGCQHGEGVQEAVETRVGKPGRRGCSPGTQSWGGSGCQGSHARLRSREMLGG